MCGEKTEVTQDPTDLGWYCEGQLGFVNFFALAKKKWMDEGLDRTFLPGTQMTLVLIGKGLVSGGRPSKIEVIWVPGIYTFLSDCIVACLYQK